MSYSSVILADSPIGYWRLGEPSGTNAADSSGNGYNGTYSVEPPTLGVTGLLTGDADTAVTMDTAYTDGVNIAEYEAFPGGNAARTLEGWFSYTSGSNNEILWTGSDTTTQGWNLRINNSGHIAVAMGTLANDFGGADLGDGEPHHVVLTYDGTTAKAYADGAQYGSDWAPGTLNTWNGSATLFIGNGPAVMTVDEVAIYGTALSLAQVQAHYNAGIGLVGPVWTTPADTDPMSTTPELKFEIPDSASAQHFWLELDTVNTFDSGDLRTYRTDVSQTDWDYWNTSAWTAFPAGGVAITYIGEEVRLSVTSALAVDTWYRRVRAGT